MRILLSGAGFIGKKLGLKLALAGHELIVLTRNPAAARLELPFPAEILNWENAQLRDIDAVVNLAGESIAAKRWTTKQKKVLLESRTKTVQDIFSLIQKCEGRKPSTFISSSAIGYYGNRFNESLYETSPSNGKGFLAEICKVWEEEAKKAETLGMRTVILRIGMVLDNSGGALAQMLPLFQRGFGSILGDGEQWMSWIYMEDLLRLIEFALDRTECKGVMNAVAPYPVTNQEFTKMLCEALNEDVFMSPPDFVLGLFLGEMSTILVEGQKVYPRRALDLGFRFLHTHLKSAFGAILPFIYTNPNHIVHEYTAQQWLPVKVNECFSFFNDSNNLEKVMPPWLGFSITEQSNSEIQEGTILEYKIKFHGIPCKGISKIESWQKNVQFMDHQLKGPFNLWEHTHSFRALSGGTLVQDKIVYSLPMGMFGDIFTSKKAQRNIEKMFQHRREVLAKQWMLL